MGKIIDELGLRREIMEMNKANVSLEEIRKKLIENHPEITIRIPHVSTISRYIEDYDESVEPLDDRIPMEQNYHKLKHFLDDYTLEARSCCAADRKDLNLKEKKLRKILEEFHTIYSHKKKEVDELLQNWGNTLSDSMCGHCKDTVIPQLKKLIEQDQVCRKP